MPGYKHSDVGVIPEDWEVRRIADFASVGSGGTPSREIAAYWGGSIPWITTSQIDFRVITEADQFITEEGLRNSAAKLLPVGTLLMALYGQGKTRGKVGVLGMAATTNQACASIALQEGVSQEFILHYLTSRYEEIRNSSNSGSQENLNGNIVKGIPVAFPPSPEQRAIAKALSDADELLATLDQVIAKKHDLKQAAMQELLTGKTRLPGFIDEWQLKRLGDVVDTDPENLGTDTATDFCFNYISLEDVDRGQLRSYSEQIFIDAPSRARRKLMTNDVLVSTVRPNLQSHLLFKGDTGHWVCSTGFCVIRCREGITCPAFVFNHFFAADVNRQIDTLLTGSNYPAINSGDVRNLEIMFPSYIEQCAIASVLSEMDAELSALEARRDKTHNIKQAMMQELLTGRTRLV